MSDFLRHIALAFGILALSGLKLVAAGSSVPGYEFQVIDRHDDATNGDARFYLRGMHGTERRNNSLNRLSMLSEDQFDYPEPASGCGPTALLNILVWYEKYGLIEPFSRNADPRRYKLNLFQEIDRRIAESAGIARTANGTRNYDAALVMDAMVRERSSNRLRVHSEYFEAPLKLSDFLQTMPNFRAGYLLVEPKDPLTGHLLNLHAATLIRADRAGHITLGTWGQKYYGMLKEGSDGQWFIPQNSDHLQLKIKGLMRFIPFEPATARAGR